MVMDPRLPDRNKSNEPVVGFISSAVPPLSIEMDALNNMRATSTDNPNGESAYPAEPDQVSFYPSVCLGKNFNVGKESCSSLDDNSPSDPVLNHVSQMLMEENMEEREWMVGPDHLALRNIEKSLYDALSEQCPDSPIEFHNFDTNQLFGSMDSSCLFASSSRKSAVHGKVTTTSCNNRIDPNWLHDPTDYNQAITPVLHPLDQVPQFNLDCSSPCCARSLSNSTDATNGLVQSSFPVKNIFNDRDIVTQFKRGLEEGSRFLLPNSQLCITFENVRPGFRAKGWIQENLFHKSLRRKSHGREDLGFKEVRVPKQVASYVEAEETELLDKFDKVLLCTEKVEPVRAIGNCLSTDASKDLLSCARLHGPSDGRGQRRGQGNSNSLVDLVALLIMCAQAISSNDVRTSNELLKQIRENSSPSGDGFQRLAHHFANGIEARMVGLAQSYYASVVGKRRSAADMLKPYQLHLSSCPLNRLTNLYMNYMIWKSSQRATVLHIIDFGIGFGFHLPILIQMLGERPGGPPKLRITGIEVPQPGFRPAQTIEETGRHLARYCDRFNVPFKYNALPSMSWEAIKVEDLMIESGEMIAVNYSVRFCYLQDETIEEDSPMDNLLNLIRRIKPDIFVHAVVNGSYNTPFFETRFRKALFHMSSIYDMLDATISSEYKDSEERIVLESEFYGQAVVNVVACEGPKRVVRPETYKQWQVRHERAGFKQLPLDPAMMKEFRHKVEAWYHEDFVLDEDGGWMLLGWKGRIIIATTSWIPA